MEAKNVTSLENVFKQDINISICFSYRYSNEISSPQVIWAQTPSAIGRQWAVKMLKFLDFGADDRL